MPLLSRMTAIVLGCMVFGTGCLGDFLEDAFSSILLDYEIDKPRVLAISLDPPILAHNVETRLDALIVGPDGLQATEASWKTCGLRDDVPTYVWSLQCFAEDTDVSLVASGGLPATYELPDLSAVRCEEDIWDWDTGIQEDTGKEEDTGWWREEDEGIECAHWLPLLVEATLDGETVQGVLHANWFLQHWNTEREIPKTARQREFSLTIEEEPAPGKQVRVELEVEGDLRESDFQWYVDSGELEKTSVTVTQRYEEPAEDAAEDETEKSWTDNLWTLPDNASGTYRLWVVWTQPWEEEDIATSVPDLVWAQTEVTLP